MKIRKNQKDLVKIEKEIFGFDVKNGSLILHYPKYWDVNKNGTTKAFLRLE